MSVARSSRPEVRNPVLAIPGVQEAIEGMTSTEREALRRLMLLVAPHGRAQADKCWKTHKAPMAVYWKGIGVYAGHFARALRNPSSTADTAVRAA